MKPSQKQLSTMDANQSRLVTRFRNVVERAFGRLKSNWKILANTITTNLWPKFHPLLRVLAATENAFSKPLWSDNANDEVDLEYISKRKESPNTLMEIAEQKIRWKKLKIDEVKTQVPSLQQKDIRDWNVGNYAITLAKPYLEHSNSLTYFQHATEKSIFKVKGLVSRFTKKKDPKKYTVYLALPSEGDLEDIHSYCTCKTGTRTLGGCAHSTAVLYNLTIDDQPVIKNASIVAQKKIENIIDLSQYKEEKKKKRQESSQEEMDEDDSVMKQT